MNSIEERFANSYVNEHMSVLWGRSLTHFVDDFVTGMKFWAEIERDKDGFATEECLEEMFANMPFVIYDSQDDDVEAVCQEDWRGDIEKHKYYTHWKPIITPKRK